MHKFKVEHPRKVGDFKVLASNEFVYNSKTKKYDNSFELSTKFSELKTKYTFKADCGDGVCEITNHLIRRFSDRLMASGYATYNVTTKQFTDQGVGFWFQSAFGNSGLTFKRDFGEGRCGTFNWRSIVNVGEGSKIGIDYKFNCNASPAPELKLGLEHPLNKDTNLKAKIDHAGWLEFGLKTKLNKSYTLLASTGFDSTAVNGKSEAVYGFGIEGSL